MFRFYSVILVIEAKKIHNEHMKSEKGVSTKFNYWLFCDFSI
jgi:hypothetical protein